MSQQKKLKIAKCTYYFCSFFIMVVLIVLPVIDMIYVISAIYLYRYIKKELTLLKLIKNKLEIVSARENVTSNRLNSLNKQKHDIQLKLLSSNKIKNGINTKLDKAINQKSDLFTKLNRIEDKLVRSNKSVASSKKDIKNLKIKLKEECNKYKLLNVKKQKLNLKFQELQKDKAIKLSFSQMHGLKMLNWSNDKKRELTNLDEQIISSKNSLSKIIKYLKSENKKLEDMKAEVNDLDSESELSEYGLYKPHYEFENTWQYSVELKNLRQQQKENVHDKTAVHYKSDWEINGSLALGKRDTRYNIKLILRSFNNECTEAIKKVRYTNYKRIKTRIYKSFLQHNKVSSIKQISIARSYLNLKYRELKLAFEYKCKKQEEKEELKADRIRKKEQKELEKEQEKKLKPIHKDIDHFNNVIKDLKYQLRNGKSNNDLIAEIKLLKKQIASKKDESKNIEDHTYNAQAGYVYIISNIGSFGENVFKIGVTRRLNPEKRIQELSSASVPFKFDVHAFIFSVHAFDLETALHHRFHKNRINLVNNHKEFFKISIKEIENELKKYKNVTVDFHEHPIADEYRQTLKIMRDLNRKKELHKILST